MPLFHVSPIHLAIGTVLAAGSRGYVCLSTSLEQATYWAITLFGRADTRRGRLESCFVYEVVVLGDGMVEDCRGHYAFEYDGVVKPASEVVPHDDLDGEVVARNPVVVTGRRVLEITDELVAAEDTRELAEIMAD